MKDTQDQKEIKEMEEQESSIDFKAIFAALKKHKKLYWQVLPVTFVVACVIVISLPNYYACEVKLAPELSMSRSSNSLSALASQFGLKMGSAASGSSEALYPALYPDLVNSTDFKVTLFNVPVQKKDSTRVMTYFDYLKDNQKEPWWSAAIGGTIKFLFSFLPTKEEGDESIINPFQLTKTQTAIVKVLEKKVICDVDNKTMAISITVTDQDPLICATVADSVKVRLQAFISDYRTQKSRLNLEYTQKLYDEAKVQYDDARQKYASYSDAHQDILYQTDRIALNELENEMQLRYNNYNSLAQQLTAAEAQLQQETPSFTTLQSATVPVKKQGPARSKIVLVLVFVAAIFTSVWILYKEDQLKPLLGLSQ